MIYSLIKYCLSLLIRLGGSVTPKLKPSAVQVIRTAKETEAQRPPENMADIPNQMREVFLRKTPLPEQIIYEFNNAVVSGNGIVLEGLHLFVPSLAFPTYEKEYSGIFLLRQWIVKKIKLDKTVGLVYDNWAVANYYHWLIDTLPRLLLLREKYPNCILLIPASAPSYVSLTVAALSFHDTFALKKDSFVWVRHLVMPSHITHPGYQEPALVQQVRKQLLNSFGYPENSKFILPAKKIYASRSRQKIRRLVNEEELIPLLIQYNFEIVYFEEMSFEQQVKTMQCTTVILGMHGANLTNILFMSPGSKVIELLNEQIPNPCYFQLASNLGLSYQALPGQPLLSTEPVNNHDITIDIDVLRKLLELL